MQMIVKCSKTGKILASEDEIKEHAEAFGVSSFEEIKPDEVMIWLNKETGKYCFTRNEMDVFCRRTGGSSDDFMEVPVSEFLRWKSSRQLLSRNDIRVENFANPKFLAALTDIRGHSVLQAEKALWFTANESASKAEDWLREHAKDPDLNVPLKLEDGAVVPDSRTPGEALSMETVALDECIDRVMLGELEEMGYSKTRAARALLKTDNSGVASAVEWISSHETDPDIDDPLPTEISRPKKTPKLSKEEAQLAALELQKKLREERAVREAAEAREKERQRLANTKAMLEQQTIMEEQKRKREIAERERLRREEEAHKAELAEKLRLDFIERFGYEPPASGTAGPATNVKPKDRVLQLLGQIKRGFDSESVKNCLGTLRLYLHNIETNSAEKKFHKIRRTNKVFQEKVAPVPLALDLLKICGFEEAEDGEFLEIKTSVADGYLCGQAVKYIDVILNQL
jgi:hypothetical protein